ncbi:hypothetical protein E4T56_gene882 [Termitomyces sp. T112]|nr:hypothetical protein E4T56_gene882 [Termitomyces sp. T112]
MLLLCAPYSKESQWMLMLPDSGPPPPCCVDASPPLAFPHREALYEDVQGVGCESPEEEEGGGEWTHTPDAESPDENIEASQTTSQQLAEAFVANSQPKPFHSTVPNHLHDFEDVFSKAFFDSLPECKQWDHAIELIPDAEPSSCKVYPLTTHEQDELDTFLQENPSSGQIQPSKSPMMGLFIWFRIIRS